MTDTKRKRRLKPYDAVPFTNSKGHVLQPGAAAIAVTTCTSRGQLRIGTYLGTRKSTYGGVGVVLEVKDSRTLLVDKNDVPYDFAAERREVPAPWSTAPRQDYYRLRYGTPEYKEAEAAYRVKYKEWQETVYADYLAKIKARKEGFAEKEFAYTWVTTLQNNNIYPAGIALADVEL